ncbi:MAG: hypothetical protein ACKOUR_10225, partial [Planctomycetota bacterium]
REFMIPSLTKDHSWRLFVDTAAESPLEIYPELDGPRIPVTGRVRGAYRSLCCYVSEDRAL